MSAKGGGLAELLRRCVLHPVLFAAIPIVIGLNEAKSQVLPDQTISTFVVVLGAAGLIFLLSWWRVKDFVKAGLLTSVALAVCFSYQGVEGLIEKISPSGLGWLALPVVVLIGGVALTSTLKETWNFGKFVFRSDFRQVNYAFNLVSIGLLLFNATPLAIEEIQDSMLGKQWVDKFDASLGPVSFSRADAAKPDVYYVITDAYANDRTLKELVNYDNELVGFLKEKGFYVVPQSATNYDRTSLSISSSLNMQYINAIPDELGKEYPSETVYFHLVQDSCVAKLFRKLGYKIVNVSSGGFATDSIPNADYNIKPDWGNDFSTAFLMLTPLWGLEQYWPVLRDQYCDRRTFVGRYLKNIADIPGPKFVLIHTELTHPPALFDAQGNKRPLQRNLLNASCPMPLYLEQLKYANKLLKEWISTILATAPEGKKPVIIVQSDHGPYEPMPDEAQYFNEVMRILNAFYFPDLKKNSLYPAITPVNSFRVLFNDYFGADLKLLPDKSFCSPVRTNPYHWRDVHAELDFGAPHAPVSVPSRTTETSR